MLCWSLIEAGGLWSHSFFDVKEIGLHSLSGIPFWIKECYVLQIIFLQNPGDLHDAFHIGARQTHHMPFLSVIDTSSTIVCWGRLLDTVQLVPKPEPTAEFFISLDPTQYGSILNYLVETILSIVLYAACQIQSDLSSCTMTSFFMVRITTRNYLSYVFKMMSPNH